MARILEQCLEYISSVQNLKVVEEVHVAPVASLPTLPTLSNFPSNDLVALVEDINQRAMRALKLLSNASNNITVAPPETKPIAQSPSDPIPSIDQVTERVSQTSISIAETSRRSKVLLVEDNPINMKVETPPCQPREYLTQNLDLNELYEECQIRIHHGRQRSRSTPRIPESASVVQSRLYGYLAHPCHLLHY